MGSPVQTYVLGFSSSTPFLQKVYALRLVRYYRVGSSCIRSRLRCHSESSLMMVSSFCRVV